MIKMRQIPFIEPPKIALRPLHAMLLAAGIATSPIYAAPQGEAVRAGAATVERSGTTTRIVQGSDRAVIDWRSFDIGSGEHVQFAQPSTASSTLNRVTGSQASFILGRLDANGQIVLVNPHGVVFGGGAQVNVGSLIASTANISNADFMAGRLNFAEPGQPGASIVNHGTINATEGGLVALVAPHVRNDGLIAAKLGKVALGSGDTFTLDLYGDALIQLAVQPDQVRSLLDVEGRPIGANIEQAGRIETGEAVLVTAAQARAVLDQVINLSGTIQAEAANMQGGRIVLVGRGGTVDITGDLSFGADARRGGSLLFDSDSAAIGITQANAFSRAMRQGAGVTVQSGNDITVNAIIDGRGGTPGGTMTLTAGTSVNINDHLLTDNGAVAVSATTGTVNQAAGKQIASGNAPISVTAGSDLWTGSYVTTGSLTLRSIGGMVIVNTDIYETTGATTITAASAIDINRTIQNVRSGSNLEVTAGTDINVNDNIGTDRSAGPSTGAVRLTAGNNIVVRQDVVTRDAPLIASAVNGTVTVVRGAQLREGNSVLKEGDADNPVRTARILCAFCAQINVTPSPSPVLHRDAPPPALPALTEIFIDAPNGVDVARFTPPPFNGDTPPPNAIAPIGLREIQPPGFAPPVSFPSRTSDPTPPVLASTPATNGTTHSAGSLPANQTGEFAALFFADKDTVTTNVNEQRVFGAALNSEPPAISPFGAAKTPVIMFGGGRGVARTADLGRGGSVGAVPNVFTEEGLNE